MRKYLILIIACLTSQLLFAQLDADSTSNGKKKGEKTLKMDKMDKKAHHVAYFHAGVQTCGLNGSDDSYDKSLLGVHFGVGIRLVQLNSFFGILTELDYSMQGSQYTETYGSGKVVLSYINLPILLRRTSKSGFYAEAGAQPGVLISAKDKYDGNTDDYKDYTKGFDVAGLLGIGYCKKRVGVGVRVAQGAIDVNKPTATDKDRNFVISLRTSFAF